MECCCVQEVSWINLRSLPLKSQSQSPSRSQSHSNQQCFTHWMEHFNRNAKETVTFCPSQSSTSSSYHWLFPPSLFSWECFSQWPCPIEGQFIWLLQSKFHRCLKSGSRDVWVVFLFFSAFLFFSDFLSKRFGPRFQFLITSSKTFLLFMAETFG